MLKLARKEHRFADGAEQKHCHKCGHWKELSQFHKNNRTWDKLNATCRDCRAEQAREYGKRNATRKADYQRRWQKDNLDKLREYARQWRTRNPQHSAEYSRKWRAVNPLRDKERRREWREANPLKVVNSQARRRARKENLPDTLTHEEQREILNFFGGCALTGSRDIHWDHVIPISTGFGGTTKENVIPLRKDLNLSKHDRNLFEWFEDCYVRLDLDPEKFEELIFYLAEINGVELEEYTEYVYSCFDKETEEVA